MEKFSYVGSGILGEDTLKESCVVGEFLDILGKVCVVVGFLDRLGKVWCCCWIFLTGLGKFVLLVDSPPASSVRVITLGEEVTARQRLSSIAEYHLLGILPINHSLGPAFQFSFFSFHSLR